MQGNTFDDLPPELLQLIISFCDLATIFQLAFVSKKYYQLVTNMLSNKETRQAIHSTLNELLKALDIEQDKTFNLLKLIGAISSNNENRLRSTLAPYNTLLLYYSSHLPLSNTFTISMPSKRIQLYLSDNIAKKYTQNFRDIQGFYRVKALKIKVDLLKLTQEGTTNYNSTINKDDVVEKHENKDKSHSIFRQL